MQRANVHFRAHPPGSKSELFALWPHALGQVIWPSHGLRFLIYKLGAVTVPLPLGYSSNIHKRQFSIGVKNVASGAKLPGFESFDKILFSWSLSSLCCQVGIPSTHHFEHLLETGGCGGAAGCVSSRVPDTSVMTVAASQGSSDRANEKAPWPWEPALALPHAGCRAKRSIVPVSSNAHRHPAKWALIVMAGWGAGTRQDSVTCPRLPSWLREGLGVEPHGAVLGRLTSPGACSGHLVLWHWVPAELR